MHLFQILRGEKEKHATAEDAFQGSKQCSLPLWTEKYDKEACGTPRGRLRGSALDEAFDIKITCEQMLSGQPACKVKRYRRGRWSI